jgi:endoglucanase
MEDWKANCIRLPVCQDRWFGRAPEQKGKGDDYRNTIDEIANYVTRSNGYLIISLNWSDAGQWGKDLGPHKMPDSNSEPFWKEVARKFKSNDRVLFDLYNEPHGVDWKVWQSGGTVTEGTLSYQAVGFEQLLNAIRKAGAKNVVVAGGLDSSYDLSGVSALRDTNGNGVVYDLHLYPNRKDWDSAIGAVATSAVIVGACGCTADAPPGWGPKVLNWMAAKNLGWAAWGMSPTNVPNLISDWTYTPTPFWGSLVREEFTKSAR